MALGVALLLSVPLWAVILWWPDAALGVAAWVAGLAAEERLRAWLTGRA